MSGRKAANTKKSGAKKNVGRTKSARAAVSKPPKITINLKKNNQSKALLDLSGSKLNKTNKSGNGPNKLLKPPIKVVLKNPTNANLNASWDKENLEAKVVFVKKFAEDNMAKYGLTTGPKKWKFIWTRSVLTFGECRFDERIIGVSKKLLEVNGMPQCKDTVLHEIAHALTEDEDEHHGPRWKAMCRKIGAKPEACYDDSTVAQVESRYIDYCPNCDYQEPRYRKPRQNAKPQACPDCCYLYNNNKFSEKYIIQYKENPKFK